MKHDTVIINKIIADEGMILTDGDSYGRVVYLGKEDRAENWHEITEERYQEILKEQEETAEGV